MDKSNEKISLNPKKLCTFLCTQNKKPLQVIKLQGFLLSGGGVGRPRRVGGTAIKQSQ
jgi:hypothetical protein